MKDLLTLVLLAGVAWFAYTQYSSKEFLGAEGESTSTYASPAQKFECDGRTHCSQMTSCAEAIYFLKNCPNTKMDGDGDGVPCESQWCY